MTNQIHANGADGKAHTIEMVVAPAEPLFIAGFIEIPADLTKPKLQIWLLENAGEFATIDDVELEIAAIKISDGRGIPKSWLDGKWAVAVKKARPAPEPEPTVEPEPEPPAADEPKREVTWKTYRAAVQRFGYAISMNDLDDTVEANGEKFSDGIEAEILMKMHDAGFKTAEWVKRSIVATAHANRYHPIRDFLSGLTWDGKDWIKEFERYVWDKHPSIIYADGSAMPVFGAWLKRWGVGAVAKIMRRGKLRGQNPMLVFAGNQDIGKSTLVRFLNPLDDDFFIESGINPDSNDHARYLATRFVWEVAELGATTRKADREALKAFLTKQDVTFRTPYAHHPVTKPATANFIGTINPENGFLTDTTGHRRFLPVEITKIDFGYLTNINCHQLWAQFVSFYNRGESAALTPEEKLIADAIRLDHEAEDHYAGFILKYYDIDLNRTIAKSKDALDSEWSSTTADIVMHLTLNGVHGANITNVGIALKQLKLDRSRQSIEGVQATRWYGLRLRPRLPTGYPDRGVYTDEVEKLRKMTPKERDRYLNQ